ncbi:MAG: hypothetical protein EOM87_04560 [Clostridia bacterium]|nr:hypothetical protein [Clostridia bacterium]
MQKTYYSKKFLYACIFCVALFIIALLIYAPSISSSRASALVWDGEVATSYAAGDGSQSTPYEIANCNQLAFLSENVNLGNDYYGVYFILTDNIEANDITNFANWGNNPPINVWSPIGLYELGSNYPFRGNFNGNSKTISGLYCNNDTNSGLFGHLGEDAAIRDLSISYSYVSAISDSAILSGLINGADITNCSVGGVVMGRNGLGEEVEYSSRLGGICGYGEDVDISDCFSNAYVSANSSAGGVVGELFSGSITTCENAGDIVAVNTYVGGLAGSSLGAITSCLNSGAIAGNDNVGGIVGESGNLGVVQKSLMLGSISGGENAFSVGMIIGSNFGTFSDNFFYKEDDVSTAVGGSTDFADAGKDRLGIVGSALQAYLGSDWTYTPKSGIIYYFPSINGRLYSFEAYLISLYSEEQLYKSVLFNADEYTLLPTITLQGYTTSWQTDTEANDWGSQVIGITPTSDTNLYLRKILNAPYFETVSSDINITYDGQYHGLQAVALSDAGSAVVNYQWYYSLTESGEYQALTFEVTSEYLVKNHNESGFYKCGAYVTDGDYVSEEARTSPIEVVIAKANASDLVVPELSVLTGVYDVSKTLADYLLPTDFYWTDPNIVPSCDRNYYDGINDGYLAYYNPDFDNYTSHSLKAYINLDKADYIGITHSSFDGVYSPTQKLSDFDLNTNFYWVDQDIIPVVKTTLYSAIYNADDINYNDFSLQITIELDKAEYEGITHVPMYGVYDKNKILADYSLYNSYYRWEQPSTVPATLTQSYNALYNADSDNYYDFEIVIALTLTKANPQVVPAFDTEGKIFVNGELPSISIESSDTEGSIGWEEYTLVEGENTYYWVFTPVDTNNYKVLRVGVEFNILVFAVEKIEIITPPTLTIYHAFNTVNTAGMVVYAYYNDDTSEEIYDYYIEYENGSSFTYGDTKFYVAYQEGENTFRDEQSVTVNKLEIPIPSLQQTYYYNGASQNHDLLDSDYYGITRESYTNAGIYYITVSLNDKDNYRWEGSDSADKSIEWVINKKIVTTPNITGDYYYNGLLQEANVVTNTEYIVYNNQQKESGTYTIIVVLKDKDNYCWDGGLSEDLSLIWTIQKYYVDFPTYTESNFVYDNTPHKAVITASNVYNIFYDTYINAGDYIAVVVLKDKNNYCFSDNSINDLEYPFSIAKREVITPVLSGEYTYNGITQKANISPDNDWYIITGDEQTNAGTHTITVSIDTANCVWSSGGSEAKTFDFVIAKLKITKPVLSGNYTYNGDEQEIDFPYNFYYSVDEEELSFINAGSYRVYVTLNDVSNTEWLGGGERVIYINYVVGKKAIQRSVFEEATFTYTGSEIIYMPVTDTNLYVINNNKNTVVGSYTATVQLRYPNNYMWADESDAPINAQWSIARQIVTKPTLAKDNYYLGYEQTAAIPEDTRYSLSGYKATNVGTYTAIISLKDTTNYIWSDSTDNNFSISWKILKAPIAKPSAGNNLVYNGITQKYILTENDAYSISGNTAKDGGEYTATVSLINKSNYEWTDGTTEDLYFVWNIYYVSAESENGESYITSFGSDGVIYPPIKEGYIFEGWYLSSDFSGEKITSVADISEDTVLYAKWTSITLVDEIVIDNKSPLSVKAIVGISVGGVLTLLAAAIFIFTFIKRGIRK